MAIIEGDLEQVTALLDSDPVRFEFSSPVFGSWLHVAAAAGRADIVRYLLRQGMDVNRCGGTFGSSALNEAVLAGRIEMVELLLEHGAVVDLADPVGSPLYSAIGCGCVDAVKVLLNSGLDARCCNANGCTALEFALKTGQDRIVELLRGAQRRAQSY